MTKYSILQTNAEGISASPIETSGRVRVVTLGEEKIRVKPKDSIIEILDANGNVTKTLEINQVPDRREFHTGLLAHITGANPKVVIDITE